MPPYAAPNQRQPPARNEIYEWYLSMPPVTRVLFTLGTLIPIAPVLGAASYDKMALVWPLVYRKAQLWRLVTCFFLQAIDMSWPFFLYFLYRTSSQLEREVFLGRTADYVYFVMITGAIQLVTMYFFGYPSLCSGLMLALSYLWSQKYRGTMISFMFGLRFEAQFLPAVQIFFEWISLRGSPPVVACVGCASAWIYDYFVTEYPRAAGVRLLDTPNWLKRMFPSGQNNMASFGNTGGSRNVRIQPGSERPSNSVTGGHNWGRGNRLG
ncbi:hypothetical protein Unana1_00101 [Umbelopsis nana]